MTTEGVPGHASDVAWREEAMRSDPEQRRRVRWTAVLLALVALGVYAGFIWLAGKGML